ncbi:hypothetical protein [Nannocystis pusilla]|uniref:hypothetical protein n=1 Tax=Nannocystis pusilla TaxID=889268 RepID=UPI003B7659C5
MISAPGGSSSTAELRALSASIVTLAAAAPANGESARHNTSAAPSTVAAPQSPTAPTSGAGVTGEQSWASVLPSSTKSPRWTICARSSGAASAGPPSSRQRPSATMIVIPPRPGRIGPPWR